MLEVTGISKQFPGVRALDDVSVTFQAGTVQALMGENGAGKSTLGKIIAGLYTPDSGSIRLDGKDCKFRSPLDAQKAGIGIVHQELLFCENLTVADNLSLGNMPSKAGFLNEREMFIRAQSWLHQSEVDIDPNAKIGSLSIAQQQQVQIASAIGQGAKVLIFDEPTSSLSQNDVIRLLDRIRSLRDKGMLCIYVSHRLEEIFAVCEKATVLRDGKLIGTEIVSEIKPSDLVRMMVGREVEMGSAPAISQQKSVAQIENLSVPGRVKNVSFEIRPGEILGFAGLVGSGRTEILESIFGINQAATGSVSCGTRTVNLPIRPKTALSLGLGLVPEDRKRHGLVLGMNIRENLSFPILPLLSKLGFINQKQESQIVDQWFKKLDVRAPNSEYAIGGLSGGNQQKVVMGRWFAANCEILLVDEPTRGVDVGAKAEIHDRLRQLASEGKAVVVVSSELPELIALSSRILVIRDGELIAELPANSTESEIMASMAGTN
jgi:ABC-type sugar transport system ATPase subunit